MKSNRASQCACCGHTFSPGEKFEVAPIIELNAPLRWVAVCLGNHATRKLVEDAGN